MTILETHNKLIKKEISATELVKNALSKIKKYDKWIRAFLTVTEESALKKAKIVDKKIAHNKEISLLEGIPYSAKDVFCTKGIKTTAGSRILENFMPPYDATVINRVDKQGAILIGKTNCDAFGFGTSTENSDFQITHNPWDLKKVPGGSSGGSAAAVLCNMGLFSIAEDTGGSIRQPANFCGVTGIKVTYGRVSRYGSIAYGSSLDTVGHITNDVEDSALVLKYTAGQDPLDSTTIPGKVPDYLDNLNKSIKNIKIGLPKEYFTKGLDPEVESAIRTATNDFRKLGCLITEISLPNTEYAINTYYITGMSEVSANLSRLDGIRYGLSDKTAKSLNEVYEKTRGRGFGPEVKRRLLLGTYAISAGYFDEYYKKAMKVRTLIKSDFDNAFRDVDIILAPVAPNLPFDIGKNTSNPLQMWLEDVFTVTLNPSGCPGLAIPCGFSKQNLPIGMQLIGPQLSEDFLFRVGYNYQKATNWHCKRPSLIS